MRLPLAAATLLIVLAGCMGCGPTVDSVEGTTVLQAEFDGNKTAFRAALEAQGFTVDEEYYGTLHAVQGDDHVYVTGGTAEGAGNTTDVRLVVQVPKREFRDSPEGSDAARRYIAEEAAAAQPRADAIVTLLRGAAGAPAPPAAALGGSYYIC